MAGALERLDPVQRACVEHPPGPLAIVAGPGSGKTRVLTARVAHRSLTGSADPRRTLVITFTRRAAGELRQRLRALGVEGTRAATVHSVALELLERYWADRGLPRRRVAAQPRRLLAAALRELDDVPAELVMPDLEWAAAHGLDAEKLPAAFTAAGRRTPFGPDLVAEAWRRYESVKRSRRVLDLGDLLTEATRALADPGFGAATSWWFRHVLVDEAQDLNRAQWRMVRAVIGRGDDLCLVGDPDQAVYGWNGADPRFLVDLAEDFPHVAQYRLTRNYRCPAPVVEAADAVLGRQGRGEAPSGSGAGADVATPAVVARGLPDEASERAFVVGEIRRSLAEGVGPGQMAVLARTNAVLDRMAEELRGASIPCRTGRRLLDTAVAKEALGRLESGHGSARGRACVAELRAIAEELRFEGGEASVDALPEDLSRLIELAEEWSEAHPTGRPAGLADWLATATRLRDGDAPAARSSVQLATFHRAKGLEWRRVFVVGLSTGLAPLPPPADQAEERRLVYVALTRAEESVTCTWAAPSVGDGAGAGSELAAIIARHAEQGDPAPLSDLSTRLRALRLELAERRPAGRYQPVNVPPIRSA